MPLVSVIIPCYNQARFLPDALESVLAQTLTDWECIVVDDGSSDDTGEVASAYAARDPRIRLLSQNNRGLAGARNRGLEAAHGRFIQFLDADDLIARDKLSLQVALLTKAYRLSIAYSDYRYCPWDDITKTTTRDNFPPPRFTMKRPLHDIAARWESEFSIPVHCFLFDRRLFSENGIRFDEELPNHEDWDCWMQVFACDPEIFHVEGSLAIYRLHNNSMCVDRKKMWDGFRRALLKQQSVFRNDPTMGRILADKFRERKKSYKASHGAPLSARIIRLTKRSFQRLTPWPIQRFLLKAWRLHAHRGHDS